MMRLYESVFIGRQDIAANQFQAFTDDLVKLITDSGGKIHKREYWGLKTLQYRIRRNRKGHYMMLTVEATPETMREYERQIGLAEDILRQLTTRIESVSQGPSIMMQNRTQRDERSTRRSEGRGSRSRPREQSGDGAKSDNPATDTPALEETS